MRHKLAKQGFLAATVIGCAAMLATPAMARAVPNAPPGYFQEHPAQTLYDRGPASFGSLPFSRGPYAYSGYPGYYGVGPRVGGYYGYGPRYYGRRAGIGLGLGIL